MIPAWEFIEQREIYYFWKYQDSDGRLVYNCTETKNPPKTDGGYYAYGYLLSVKGLIQGVTLNSLFGYTKRESEI